MTQEEYETLKELMLKDLCARLPYGVIGQCEIDASYDTSFETKPQTHKFDAEVYGLLEEGLLFVTPLIEDQDVQELANEEVADGVDILDFKPYLFPLSSMTEEMIEEFNNLFNSSFQYFNQGVISASRVWDKNEPVFVGELECSKLIDWFNAYHIDYRGLIEKGFAIDATDKNIY